MCMANIKIETSYHRVMIPNQSIQHINSESNCIHNNIESFLIHCYCAHCVGDGILGKSSLISHTVRNNSHGTVIVSVVLVSRSYKLIRGFLALNFYTSRGTVSMKTWLKNDCVRYIPHFFSRIAENVKIFVLVV